MDNTDKPYGIPGLQEDMVRLGDGEEELWDNVVPYVHQHWTGIYNAFLRLGRCLDRKIPEYLERVETEPEKRDYWTGRLVEAFVAMASMGRLEDITYRGVTLEVANEDIFPGTSRYAENLRLQESFE